MERLTGKERFAFWAIFLFAAVVRLKGLSTGLPLHTLYGENDTLTILLQILRTGDLNPHTFAFPGLAYYLYLPVVYAFYFVGALLGVFSNPASVPEASLVFLGRLVSAGLGLGTVFLLYKIAARYSRGVALLASAILAAAPQHIEFCHMLRPEVPAIFFLLLAHDLILSILDSPTRKRYWLFGLWWGVTFSLKYNVGFPLFLPLLATFWMTRKESRWHWLIEAGLCFLVSFSIFNPYLVIDPSVIPYWIKRADPLYLPAETYYGKGMFYFYGEFLSRYNYNLPILVFSVLGIAAGIARDRKRSAVLYLYPIFLFLWLCTYKTRRIHGLLPLHPYLALWAGIFLDELWRITRDFSRAAVFKVAYGTLIGLALFSPYYRSLVQTYLFSRTDNRSKAELWMIKVAPPKSKIAVLQFQHIELDPKYFDLEMFSPKDYIQKKDFQWFRDHGFDYVTVSSGQYSRYFTEGKQAEQWKDYFLKLFKDGQDQGTLVLDLTTHPLLIPDYRVKIWSTHKLHESPAFLPAIDLAPEASVVHLASSETSMLLRPGYYSLEVPEKNGLIPSVAVRNLKLSETILQTQDIPPLSAEQPANRFPFAIFPVRIMPRFELLPGSHPEMTPDQPVKFSWKGIPEGIDLMRIDPPILVNEVELSSHRYDPALPYLVFRKKESFRTKCTLTNHSSGNVSGHLQAFLSEVGEIMPWKAYDAVSDTEDFFLNPGQTITIDIPMNTGTLSGDHDLSYWVFTRQDLPFSPQNGGWLNKQIRIEDPRLGVHPIYNIPIP